MYEQILVDSFTGINELNESTFEISPKFEKYSKNYKEKSYAPLILLPFHVFKNIQNFSSHKLKI